MRGTTLQPLTVKRDAPSEHHKEKVPQHPSEIKKAHLNYAAHIFSRPPLITSLSHIYVATKDWDY